MRSPSPIHPDDTDILPPEPASAASFKATSPPLAPGSFWVNFWELPRSLRITIYLLRSPRSTLSRPFIDAVVDCCCCCCFLSFFVWISGLVCSVSLFIFFSFFSFGQCISEQKRYRKNLFPLQTVKPVTTFFYGQNAVICNSYHLFWCIVHITRL